MLRLHAMKVQDEAPQTYQEQQYDQNNDSGIAQNTSNQLITIDDQPLRVPFKTSQFYQSSYANNQKKKNEEEKPCCGIEFIMTAEVCPKKTRAAAVASMMNDHQINKDNQNCETRNENRKLNKGAINRSFTLNEAQMFQTHDATDMEICDQNKLSLFEAQRQTDEQENQRQSNNGSKSEIYKRLKKNTGYKEEKKSSVIASIAYQRCSQKLRSKTDVANSTYHSDGEISSMSPHKSPRRMTSPEKLIFKNKLFAMDDKVSRKVQRAMKKANEVRSDMRDLITSANEIQQTYQYEQDRFIKAMEVKQERLKSSEKPNRFLDNTRYKRVGDLTDPKTLVRPAFVTKEPKDPSKKDAHESCCGNQKAEPIQNIPLRNNVHATHQRQSTMDTECLQAAADRLTTYVQHAEKSQCNFDSKSQQRKSVNYRYAHVMPRVFTGRSQMNSIMLPTGKDQVNADITKCVKNLTRQKSAHQNRKRSVQLDTQNKHTATSLIKLQMNHKPINTNSGTPLAAKGGILRDMKAQLTASAEGTCNLMVNAQASLHANTALKEFDCESTKSGRSGRSQKSQKLRYQQKNPRRSKILSTDTSKVFNSITQQQLSSNQTTMQADYQPPTSCALEVVKESSANKQYYKSRSSQRINQLSQQIPAKITTTSSNTMGRPTKSNRNFLAKQQRTSFIMHNQKRKTQVNAPAIIRDTMENISQEVNIDKGLTTPTERDSKQGFKIFKAVNDAHKYETNNNVVNQQDYESVTLVDYTNKMSKPMQSMTAEKMPRTSNQSAYTPSSKNGKSGGKLRIKKFFTRESKENEMLKKKKVTAMRSSAKENIEA